MEATAVTPRSGRRIGARSTLLATMALMAVTALPAPVFADETVPPVSEAQHVIDIATAQLGAKYSFASSGPNTFDCSGLIAFAFREAGLLDRIGSKRRTVAGYLKYFQSIGKADRNVGQPGDLIIWGKNTHMGIYLGDGMAISTLINPYGVKIHPVLGYIGMKVKAYLHVDLTR
ncbi:MAG: NlpC/P60 family protein [Candidatus Limnocylindrales bacterium]